ncbi:MAG: hypothetical protein ABW082_02490 [Sedimenticola sp.]
MHKKTGSLSATGFRHLDGWLHPWSNPFFATPCSDLPFPVLSMVCYEKPTMRFGLNICRKSLKQLAGLSNLSAKQAA